MIQLHILHTHSFSVPLRHIQLRRSTCMQSYKRTKSLLLDTLCSNAHAREICRVPHTIMHKAVGPSWANCRIYASKKRKHANSECQTVVVVETKSFVSTIQHEKLSKLSNRWHVTLSLWLSQCSADEAFDSSGNNLGLDGLSNPFIETVQSQQTYLYIHLMSLNVQQRLSPTISTMDSGLKDISKMLSSALVWKTSSCAFAFDCPWSCRYTVSNVATNVRKHLGVKGSLRALRKWCNLLPFL